MATLPSSLQSKSESEAKHESSSEVSKSGEKCGLKSQQVQSIPTAQKAFQERQTGAISRAALPGTYYLQANKSRGKHVVRYVHVNPTDETLPFHIRERYREIQRERHCGYQYALNSRGSSSIRQHEASDSHFDGNKMPRPASARHEERALNVSIDTGHRGGKCAAGVINQVTPANTMPKAVAKSIQQTRSSNTVLSPKRVTRSRSKASSPRLRRPFSIAAESTSDTDPVENKRSVESIPHRSSPRTSGGKQIRQQQYLATKFKLATKNSKHTQTFVAAAASVEDSSGSATTVISRHHLTTQTEIVGKNATTPASIQPDCEIESKPEEKDTSGEIRRVDAEKLPNAPKTVANSEAVFSTLTEKGQESLEWKRAKLRLRSTPRSPSPHFRERQHRVTSVDRVCLPSEEKPSCLTGGRAASGHSELSLPARSLTPPAPERQFITSATQMDRHQTTDTGVQVKLKKKRPPSQRQARQERRSPSQRSVVSILSSQTGGKTNKDHDKTKINEKKQKKKNKSRDPSIHSIRSLRSFQSDVSNGILKQVKIYNSSPAISRSRKSASVVALGETAKKKKKTKGKKNKTSIKIARFLRTLSNDKEAIKVISKMAAIKEKKASK